MQSTQPTVASPQSAAGFNPSKNQRESTIRIGSPVTAEEINAYVATRDGLLAEAEKMPTLESIHRAVIANDVVQTCLRPARQPYVAQYLPTPESVRELERCNKVTQRIVKMRSSLYRACDEVDVRE